MTKPARQAIEPETQPEIDPETQAIVDTYGYDYRDEPEFLREAYRYKTGSKTDAAEYVAQEINRMVAERKPVLRAILKLKDERLRDAALAALKQVSDYQTTLMLVRDCGERLPTRDVHGAPLPADKVGKVLDVKIGNAFTVVGNDLDKPKLNIGVARDERLELYRSNPKNPANRIYNTIEIRSRPRLVNQEIAVQILQNWGYGVRKDRMVGPRSTARQDMWLVVEVCNGD